MINKFNIIKSEFPNFINWNNYFTLTLDLCLFIKKQFVVDWCLLFHVANQKRPVNIFTGRFITCSEWVLIQIINASELGWHHDLPYQISANASAAGLRSIEFFWLPDVHRTFELGWQGFFQSRALQSLVYGSKHPQFHPITLGHIKRAVLLF